jgi:cytochrome c biogenesis protein CcmG, thiol:disulfide interchange protein DsbE
MLNTRVIRIIETVPSVRLSSIVFVLALVSVVGCDRGSHPTQVGQRAPGFTVTESDRTVRLDNFRGKVVVLNFWATWCAPCIEELPTLIAMQHRLPDVVVLAVSTDEDAAAYRQFITDNHIDLLTVRDGAKQSSKLYGTERFPETYVIDQDGMIRRRFIGAQNWMSPEILNYLRALKPR